MASQAPSAAKILSTHIAGTPLPVGHLYVLVVSGTVSKSLVTGHTLEPPMLFDAMVYHDIDHVKNLDKSHR